MIHSTAVRRYKDTGVWSAVFAYIHVLRRSAGLTGVLPPNLLRPGQSINRSIAPLFVYMTFPHLELRFHRMFISFLIVFIWSFGGRNRRRIGGVPHC